MSLGWKDLSNSVLSSVQTATTISPTTYLSSVGISTFTL